MSFGLITSIKLKNKHLYVNINELHYTDKENLSKYIIINSCKYRTTDYEITMKYNLNSVNDYYTCMHITTMLHYNSSTVATYNTNVRERNIVAFFQTHNVNRNIVLYDYNSRGVSKNIKLLKYEQLQLKVF